MARAGVQEYRHDGDADHYRNEHDSGGLLSQEREC